MEQAFAEVVVLAFGFERVPDNVLHPDDATKYLEAIVGSLDRINPADRPRLVETLEREADQPAWISDYADAARMVLSHVIDDEVTD